MSTTLPPPILLQLRKRHDLKERLPDTGVLLEVISYFEAAVWRSVKPVFGEQVRHRGCVFHWTQAVWRRMQELGLSVAFRERDSIHRYCRRLMSLPFLPADAIPEAFTSIKDKARAPQLQELVSYVETNWITSAVGPPTTWSVYRRSVRTNNDVEGWRSRLNRKAKADNLALYKLIARPTTP